METKNRTKANETPSIIIGKLLNIGGILHREENRMLLPYDLNQQQFSVFFEICKAGKVNQKDIVNRLMLERAHVSKIIKKLETRGLVQIVASKQDKRSSIISATEKGQQLLQECLSMFDEWNKEWFASISDDEQTEIVASLSKLQFIFKEKIETKN